MPDDDPLPAHRQEVVIGALGPGRVAIVDHDASWWGQFGAHARGVRHALGAAAIRIEHIGSTSVPGLAAKPVIDILSTCSPMVTGGRAFPATARASAGTPGSPRQVRRTQARLATCAWPTMDHDARAEEEVIEALLEQARTCEQPSDHAGRPGRAIP